MSAIPYRRPYVSTFSLKIGKNWFFFLYGKVSKVDHYIREQSKDTFFICYNTKV